MAKGIEQTAGTNQGYRSHYLQADIKLSTLIVLIWLIAIILFIPVDYASLGLTKEFYTFLTARLLFTGGLFLVVLGFRHTTTPRHYDILISFVILMGIAFSIFGSVMFKQDYVGQIILDILVIITIYAIFPGPLTTKVVASLLISAKAIYFLSTHEQIFADSEASILTSLGMTNILGYFAWRSIKNFRYQQFTNYTELKQARKEAEYLAHTDPLTNINNRRAFMEQSQEEFFRSQRYQRPLSLFLIDIDDFKSINDKYGHQAGDSVLINFSQITKSQIREQDILGRIGGDEFGILLPETTLEAAHTIAIRLCKIVRQNVVNLQDKQISTSCSAGLATQTSDETFEQFLRRADQKLYQAKSTGKGHIEI